LVRFTDFRRPGAELLGRGLQNVSSLFPIVARGCNAVVVERGPFGPCRGG
jgi:hypothetical protein